MFVISLLNQRKNTMAKFKTKSETSIDIDNDSMFVVIEFEEDEKNEALDEEFRIPYALYQLTPTEARLLAAHLVEQAAECTQNVPSDWYDPEVN